jgi:hypothetical protein
MLPLAPEETCLNISGLLADLTEREKTGTEAFRMKTGSKDSTYRQARSQEDRNPKLINIRTKTEK